MTTRPDRNEAAPYYFTYIDQVDEGDICDLLDSQGAETLALLSTIGDEQSHHRYAADKWTIREVVGHLNDTERLFAFRALWFARGFDTPLPSFDHTSPWPPPARSSAPGKAISTSIERCALRRRLFFGTCLPMPGRGAASQVTTRSRCARLRTWRWAT